jgi:hypothetical protein
MYKTATIPRKGRLIPTVDPLECAPYGSRRDGAAGKSPS